jgi:hypothetical protein
MFDRYTRVVLTIIAACLVYLCLVVSRVGTPLSAQQAQPPQGAVRPGMGTGPAEVVVVGFRLSPDETPLGVVVRNTVTTQPSADNATRVVVAGWEDSRLNRVVRLTPEGGLPVDAAGSTRPAKMVLVGTETMSGVTWEKRVPVEPPREATKR